MSATETTTAVTALPSGTPIPASTPASAPTPAPIPSIPIGAILNALPSHADAFLTTLTKCMSTTSGADTVLFFIAYTSRLAALGLTTLSASALRRSAREWLALVAALPPRTTILFTADGATKLPTTSAAAAALALAKRLGALASLLTEVRTAMRLWGLLGLYMWARQLVLKRLAARKAAVEGTGSGGEKAAAQPVQSAIQTAVEWAPLVAITGFQVLENVAFLGSKGVLGLDKTTQALAGRWSVRCWALYVGMELGRLAAEGLNDGKGGRIKKTEDQVVSWRKDVVRNLSWAPLTISWSMENGFAGESMVAVLGSIPAVIQMRDLWMRGG